MWSSLPLIFPTSKRATTLTGRFYNFFWLKGAGNERTEASCKRNEGAARRAGRRSCRSRPSRGKQLHCSLSGPDYPLCVGRDLGAAEPATENAQLDHDRDDGGNEPHRRTAIAPARGRS